MRSHSIPLNLKKTEKTSVLCARTWFYDRLLEARTVDVLKIVLATVVFEPLKFDCTCSIFAHETTLHYPTLHYITLQCATVQMEVKLQCSKAATIM